MVRWRSHAHPVSQHLPYLGWIFGSFQNVWQGNVAHPQSISINIFIGSWAEDRFSPDVMLKICNVYLTQSIKQNGDWENIFSYWERQLVIYVGAAAMYMIGKRLKKRHHLLDDVRLSLYQEVNHFLKTVKSKGTPFLGGNLPNLADLAVYACIISIEGSLAFDDLMRNTNLAPWYTRMQQVIDGRRGKVVKT